MATRPDVSAQRPWYDGDDLLVALLVLLAPIGVALMWLRRPRWDAFFKGVVSVYGLIWLYTAASLLLGPATMISMTASMAGPRYASLYQTPTSHETPVVQVASAPVAATPTTQPAPPPAATTAPAAPTTPTAAPATVPPSSTSAASTPAVQPPTPAIAATVPDYPENPTAAPTKAPASAPYGAGATATPAADSTPGPYAGEPATAPTPPTPCCQATNPQGGYPLLPPTATAGPSLNTVLEERFTDNQHGWPSDRRGPAALVDGGYRLFAMQPGQPAAVHAPIEEPLGDVIVTARFTRLGTPSAGVYGLIVRDQRAGYAEGFSVSGQYYLFLVDDRGQVGIRRRDGDFWTELAPWSEVEGVRTGPTASNELVARAVGTRLTFRVNGTLVAAVEDDAFVSGAVGLYAAGNQTEVVVSSFLVQAPAT